MRLEPIPATHVDFAWKDGANCLAKACDTSGGEITGDQLKLLISRGERTLLRMVDDEQTAGWGVVSVEQKPNMRILWVCEVVAPNIGFERYVGEVKKMAFALGCSVVRCAAKPVQERLYRMKCGFEPVYQIMEVKV
ncbi:MAG: hypothetical protein H6R01_432 [Burkholderiaceae bacterium]|nr:hypothetical protein [Burkholderiaceae bacterium]